MLLENSEDSGANTLLLSCESKGDTFENFENILSVE